MSGGTAEAREQVLAAAGRLQWRRQPSRGAPGARRGTPSSHAGARAGTAQQRGGEGSTQWCTNQHIVANPAEARQLPVRREAGGGSAHPLDFEVCRGGTRGDRQGFKEGKGARAARSEQRASKAPRRPAYNTPKRPLSRCIPLPHHTSCKWRREEAGWRVTHGAGTWCRRLQGAVSRALAANPTIAGAQLTGSGRC